MRRLLSSIFLLASMSTSAQAAEWYLGVGAVAELDDRTPNFGSFEPDTETARTLLAGFGLGNDFAIEASYVDLGDAVISPVADAGYAVDGELWTAGVVWSPDTGPLRPYAKLGWFSRSEDGQSLTIAGPSPIDFDDDGLMAELGGRWFITDAFALRAGYARYDFDRDADGSVQVAAELHFGR